MKRFIIYTERQRKEIEKYLRVLPRAMPSYVRQLRMSARKVDFGVAFKRLVEDHEQAMEDLALMRRLAELEVPIGRKDKGYRDLRAVSRIRRRSLKTPESDSR